MKNFENLIDDYRKEAYTRAVEDFLTAFEACEFHHDEFLFGLSDAFKKRGLNEIASYLDSAAQVIPQPGTP
ncbi:hypothetical protein [Tolypothrix sp. VBCCA 56010]|uniref:hypothetical protein n=1 Tax=Tolypothrix sp. VBCCA 56010 TaxID=3137731 RepID=UPI003D7D9CEB